MIKFRLFILSFLCTQIVYATEFTEIWMKCALTISQNVNPYNLTPKVRYDQFSDFLKAHAGHLKVDEVSIRPWSDYSPEMKTFPFAELHDSRYYKSSDVLKLKYTNLVMQGNSYVKDGLLEKPDFTLDPRGFPIITHYEVIYPRFTERPQEFAIKFMTDLSSKPKKKLETFQEILDYIERVPALFGYRDNQDRKDTLLAVCDFRTPEIDKAWQENSKNLDARIAALKLFKSMLSDKKSSDKKE